MIEYSIMKIPGVLLLIICVFLVQAANPQAKPLAADNILKEARSKAGTENKKVFVIFHASWCGWCHKMEDAINDESVRKYFNDNYIIRYLTVYESAGKEKLENPGALELLKTYKGNDLGIPYWLIFDKDGNLLADSKARQSGGGLETGDNTGCPAGEQEVAHFINVLKQTSSLNDTELAVIEKRFLQNGQPN
jgi:thioredoxin-related protein